MGSILRQDIHVTRWSLSLNTAICWQATGSRKAKIVQQLAQSNGSPAVIRIQSVTGQTKRILQMFRLSFRNRLAQKLEETGNLSCMGFQTPAKSFNGH